MNVPKEIIAHPPRGPQVPVGNARFGYRPRVSVWVSCARLGCPEQGVATVMAPAAQAMLEVRPGGLLVALRVCEPHVEWAKGKFSQKSIVKEGIV